MGCYWSKGRRGFICGDLGPHCTNCGTVGDVLCDYPVGDGKTCDRQICQGCAHLIGPDLHYCIPHFAEWSEFVVKGGVTRELENVIPFRVSPP